MTIDTSATHAPARVHVPRWAWLLVPAVFLALYLITQDNGVALGQAARFVHEFTHDGRHAFGVPCH